MPAFDWHADFPWFRRHRVQPDQGLGGVDGIEAEEFQSRVQTGSGASPKTLVRRRS